MAGRTRTDSDSCDQEERRLIVATSGCNRGIEWQIDDDEDVVLTLLRRYAETGSPAMVIRCISRRWPS